MSEEETVQLLKQATKASCITCHHLHSQEAQGFNVPKDIETAKEAWCDECEKILQEEGEWNDRACEFANFKAACRCCFEGMKSIHLSGGQ